MPQRAAGYQVTTGFVTDASLRDSDNNTGYEIEGSSAGDISLTVKLDLGPSNPSVKYLEAYIKYKSLPSVAIDYWNGSSWVSVSPSVSPPLTIHGGTYSGGQFTWTLSSPVSARYWRFSFKDTYVSGTPKVGCFEIWLENSSGEEIPELDMPSSVDTISTDSQALSAAVHALSSDMNNLIELFYRRNGEWNLFPVQPVVHGDDIIITKQYREPVTAEFFLPNKYGVLTPEDMDSSYNYNDSVYEALLDEARKIRIRLGLRCYQNLASGKTPSSTLSPSSGSLTLLTDGDLIDIATTTTGFVSFSPTSASPFYISIDLSSSYRIRHMVIRFGSKSGSATLPSTVNFEWSTDNVTWNTGVTKPVKSDWNESETGQVINIIHCDLDVNARYVRAKITPTGSQTIMVDEFAVYGGNTFTYIGQNIFTGYLGDSMDIPSYGKIKVTATGVLKKLADNNEVRLTAIYGGPSGPVDAGDILYSLLTSTTYWRGTGEDYDAPFSSSEIGWSLGSDAAQFKYPVWQGQANNMMGYCYEIMHSLGMELYEDGDGVLYLREPPYRVILPYRIYVADADGNGEVWYITRTRSGKDLRNIVEVATGKSEGGSFRTVMYNVNSYRKYGRRRVIITDPIAVDVETRRKICKYVLRDYAFRVGLAACNLKMSFTTDIKDVIGIRASMNPKMYPKGSTTSGDKRLQELWSIESLEQHISVGNWYAEAQLTPYKPAGPDIVTDLSATPRVGDPTIVDLAWTVPSDTSNVWGYGVYYSTEGETTGYPSTPQVTVSGASSTGVAVTGLTNGVKYYFYVVTISNDEDAVESSPSDIIICIAGSSSTSTSKWAVTDLAAGTALVSTPVDSNGYYTYDIPVQWTAPPIIGDPGNGDFGFKHGCFYIYPNALPSNPDDPKNWRFVFELSVQRVPPGKMWDRVTSGYLNANIRFKSPTNLSGVTMYVKMFTWRTTNGRHGPPHPSNYTTVVLP